MCCNTSPRRALLFVLLLALPLLFTACGKKGDPQPPIRVVPAAVQDLVVRQQGPDFLLEMSFPKFTTSGMALPALDRIEVLQLLRPAPAEGFQPEVDALEFKASAEVLRVLGGNDLSQATSGDRLYVRLPVPQPTVLPAAPAEGALAEDALAEAALAESSEAAHQLHAFAVRSITAAGEESALSNFALLVPTTAPEPPTGINLVPGPEGIEITWTLPAGEVEGFHVYRRDARSRAYPRTPIRVEGDQPRAMDTSARFGNRYIYTVTTVTQLTPLIESRLSGEAEVSYQDRFPPAVPGGLVVLAEIGRVRLNWDRSPSGDVAGYYVYRRGGGEGDFRRLNAEPQTRRELVDEDVTSGRTYTYRITAVDALGNESAPGNEVLTSVR